jgi:hypothetical protein
LSRGSDDHHRPFGKNVSANVFEVHIVNLHVELIKNSTLRRSGDSG